MADTGRRAPLAPTAQNDTQSADETRMRRALGLGTGSGQHTPQQRPEQARARHRFVQDGGVPVVMMGQKTEPETTALRERITSLETQLENERHAHDSTRRQLKEQADHFTSLQTRLAHTELAHKEALNQERQMRVAAQEALQEALAAVPPRRARPAIVQSSAEPNRDDSRQPAYKDLDAVASTSDASPSLAPASAPPAPASRPDDATTLEVPLQQKRGRGRPRSTTPPEPKPVRWWTPSYRTKSKS